MLLKTVNSRLNKGYNLCTKHSLMVMNQKKKGGGGLAAGVHIYEFQYIVKLSVANSFTIWPFWAWRQAIFHDFTISGQTKSF